MSNRFFVALLPPEEIQILVRSIQQEFVDRYASRAALKLPPHITLQPPFECSETELPQLIATLEQLAGQHIPIPIALHGFGVFEPHVVYVQVLQTPELLTMQQGVMTDMAAIGIADPANGRTFTPHITVGFRDLTPENFQVAWAEFQSRPFAAGFTVPRLTLLRHDGQRWQIDTELLLAGTEAEGKITGSSPAHRPET